MAENIFSDEELISKSLNDKVFFAELINRYEKRLFVYLKRFGLGDKDVEDLLQEIFINVYRNLNAFDNSLKFSSWVYRISHNVAVSFLRKNKIETVELSDFVAVDNEKFNDIMGKLDLKFLKRNVSDVLVKMDFKYREVLILKYFEDRDYSEISDILKKPIGTVSTLINRAKKQFKELYKELNFDNK